MYKELFRFENVKKTVESVQEAFEKNTGCRDWCYNTMEDIEKAEKAGYLEFVDGDMIVYVDRIL